MTLNDLCSEDEIAAMVHAFYGKVRNDAVLGPVFNAHVTDWDHHLGKMVDLWSGMMRGTGRYRGTPMPKHVALPGLDGDMFRHWLSLFHETTLELNNEAMRARANDLAYRVAQSLWYGYQLNNNPEAIPGDIPASSPT
jgi:hemoglobin